MRLRFASILILVLSFCAFGQTYTINTVAGGGLPVNVPGPSATLAWVRGVAVDAAGNVFMTLDYYHAVLRLDAKTGFLTQVAGNGVPGFSGDGGPATAAQLNGPGGIAVDSTGNLYIADSGNRRIRKVSGGVITTVAGNGTQGFSGDNGPATSAMLNTPEGVAVDFAGNLYLADWGDYRIREVSKGMITTVAGNGLCCDFSGDNGPATSAQLAPFGVAVDSAGSLYFTDGGARVRRVSGGVITTVAGNGTTGFSGDNGPAISAQLDLPAGGVAVDSAGNLYIADTFNNRIRRVSNGVITTVAGGGSSFGDNAPATSAELSGPVGVAVASTGNLYIAGGGQVREVSNGVITTLAGNGMGSFGGDNGPATNTLLNGPVGVALDSSGNLYIADDGNFRIRKVSNGVITTVAGGGASLGDNGPATSAYLYHPSSVALDSAGNLYVGEPGDCRVRKVSNGVITTVAGNGVSGPSGGASPPLYCPSNVALDSVGNLYFTGEGTRVYKVSNGVTATVAGNGTQGFSGDNGPATSAQFYGPAAVAVDASGNIYVADSYNQRIRKVSNGVITTVAGNGIQGFDGDNGPATSAQLNVPEGLAVDSAGNLYIADTGNNRIRKVSNGVITTVAGTGPFAPSAGFSGDNGPATNAQLGWPHGLAVDSAGNVYVADDINNRIRVLIPSGPSCSASVTPATLSSGIPGGNLAITIQTSASCLWAVQSLPSWISYSANAMGTGPATIVLTVDANPGASRSAAVSIAGISVSVTQQGSAPSIMTGGVVNAASYAAGMPLAPGSIAAAYGSFFLTSTYTAASRPLPTSLSGLSVQLGSGLAAPLFYADAGQVNLQVPWELAGQPQTSLAATLNGQTGAAQAVTLAPFAPGIFTINGQGKGQGAIVDPSYRLVDSSNPAIAGSTVVLIYCTGLGPVTNQPATGSPALFGTLAATTAAPTVTIGGAPATVQFSGLAPGFVGLHQVNALVPATASKGAAVAVVISIGGATSNTVTMAVQ